MREGREAHRAIGTANAGGGRVQLEEPNGYVRGRDRYEVGDTGLIVGESRGRECCTLQLK